MNQIKKKPQTRQFVKIDEIASKITSKDIFKMQSKNMPSSSHYKIENSFLDVAQNEMENKTTTNLNKSLTHNDDLKKCSNSTSESKNSNKTHSKNVFLDEKITILSLYL